MIRYLVDFLFWFAREFSIGFYITDVRRLNLSIKICIDTLVIDTRCFAARLLDAVTR